MENREIEARKIAKKHEQECEDGGRNYHTDTSIANSMLEFNAKQTKSLLEEIEGLKEALEDKHRLTLEIEKAMFGDEGAKNPSLCDVLKSVVDMKSRITELEKSNETTLSAWRDKNEDLTFSLDKINELEENLEYSTSKITELTSENKRLSSIIENYMGFSDLVGDEKIQSRISELESKLKDAESWNDVSIEPEFGGEYNVVYDLEDGETELIVTTLMYCKKEKLWRDERGANYIVNTVKLWRELPNKPKTN